QSAYRMNATPTWRIAWKTRSETRSRRVVRPEPGWFGSRRATADPVVGTRRRAARTLLSASSKASLVKMPGSAMDTIRPSPCVALVTNAVSRSPKHDAVSPLVRRIGVNPALIRSTSASSGMVQVPRPTRATDSLVALGADNVDDGSETINVPPSDTQLR